MCKNCGDCTAEHGGRTIDDAVDEILDSPVQAVAGSCGSHTTSMRYTAWLWEQLDEDSPLGKFAKVCYDDVNNGCASPKFSAGEWISHFEQVHRDNKDELISRFFTSFVAYNKFKKAE